MLLKAVRYGQQGMNNMCLWNTFQSATMVAGQFFRASKAKRHFNLSVSLMSLSAFAGTTCITVKVSK